MRVLKFERDFSDFVFKDPEFFPIGGEEKSKFNCGAASKSMCFTPSRELKMCPLSDPTDLCLGNVYYEDLDTILSRNFSSRLVELEDPRPEICGECEHLWFCQRCIARGLRKYLEIGEICKWGENPRLISILEEAKKFDKRSYKSG